MFSKAFILKANVRYFRGSVLVKPGASREKKQILREEGDKRKHERKKEWIKEKNADVDERFRTGVV